MAKRTKRGAFEPQSVESEPLRNDAFASLAALRDELVAGQPAPEQPVQPEADGAAEAEALGPKVVVTREKKGRRGKTVTRIAGLGLEAAPLKALAKSLQRALGCGAIVEDEDILLQGNQTERVEGVLRAHGAKRVIIGN